MSLKALIFDVDGTLANTEHDGHLRAFNETFKLFELDWHWDTGSFTVIFFLLVLVRRDWFITSATTIQI